MTYLELLPSLLKTFQFKKCDIDEVLACHFSCDKSDLVTLSDSALQEKLPKILSDLDKMKQGTPLAQVLGQVSFYGYKFSVNNHVLIPRQETELLVDRVIKRFSALDRQVIFDLCSGSGVIGISLQKAFPDSTVYLVDISPKANQLAQRNSENLKVSPKILEGNLLEPCHGLKANLVVCNPPYISKGEYGALERDVKDFEPKIALTDNSDGLEFYRRLSVDLPKYCQSKAAIALEFGYRQKVDLLKIFSRKPFINLQFEKDYAGHDRFLFLEIE